MFLKFPQLLPKVVHHGKHLGDILNVPLSNIFGALFQFFLNFTGWEHCNHTTGNIAKEILNEPLRQIQGTFFGKIYDFPMVFLTGTLWSHDLGHFECYKHFSHWEHCSDTNLGNFE